jgi:hypothetical protein
MASSSKQILKCFPSQNDGNMSWIPEGYVTAAGLDGKDYLMLELMVLTLHQSFETYHKKVDFGVHSATGSVSVFSF